MVLRVCGTRAAWAAARPQHSAGMASSTKAAASLQSALLVTRAPVVLQAPSGLEREYYRFNVALSNRLQQPFAREQYFKKGSAAESRFDEFYAQLQKTWDLQTATKTPDAPRAASGAQEAEADLYATMPRETKADQERNVQSLERALDRTLYLAVQRDGTWRLPTKALPGARAPTDSLHDTATEAVTEPLGTDMDLWLVSKLPIAVVQDAAQSNKVRARDSHRRTFSRRTSSLARRRLRRAPTLRGSRARSSKSAGSRRTRPTPARRGTSCRTCWMHRPIAGSLLHMAGRPRLASVCHVGEHVGHVVATRLGDIVEPAVGATHR